MLTALILALAGAPSSAIANDYALTRVGIEPAREQLLVIFQEQAGFDLDQPGIAEMFTIKGDIMLSFLEMLEERWGGVEGYMKEELGLTDADRQIIRANLRGDNEQLGS